MKAFFSPNYTVEMGDHVFPTVKFALTAEKLIKDGVLTRTDLVEPAPASREDLILAHDAAYVDRALEGRFTPRDLELLELPYSPELVRAHRLAAGGTIAACREALKTGLGLHIGGGSHHAMPGHGEGFCMFNDLAIGALRLLADGAIQKVLVVDLDVHQGNGTAAIAQKFLAPWARGTAEGGGVGPLLTFSMHQQSNYPLEKPASTLDIGLADGVGDDDYLAVLRKELHHLLEWHEPDLVVYQAGADVFAQDLLGGLKLTRPGIERRDREVFEQCFRARVPVAVTLGGGYAARLEDTVGIHAATLRIAIQCHLPLPFTGGGRGESR